MKKIVLALALVMLSAVPARADHDGNYYAMTWWNSGSEAYCLEGFAGPLSNDAYSNMKVTTTNRVNYVEQATNLSKDFYMLADSECLDNYDFWDWNCSLIIDLKPGLRSRIDYQNVPGGGAETRKCDVDGNQKYDFFWIVIDPEEPGWNLHWGGVGTSVAEGHFDYAGLLVHEFVHATGFGTTLKSHFASASDACSSHTIGNYNTMCSGTNLGVQNAGVSNGTWWRTLEGHDIGEINQNY